jgi:tripartite-type tricarboxylate transporter receptor subunit TctC
MMKAALLLLAIQLGFVRAAQAADDFYKGKTLKIFSGTTAGSGTDAYARLIQQYFGKHIPGNPSVVVENMPAGNGLAAINHIYNIAAKDGTEIGLFNRSALFAPLLGDDNAKFAPELLNWIGTPGSFGDDAWVFMVRSDLPYRSFEDLRRADPPLNVAGSNVNPFIALLYADLGVKMKIVYGYANQEMALALQRSEVDAIGNAYLSVVSTTPDLLTKNIARIMVQFGHDERLPALVGVPTGRELAHGADDSALIDLADFSLTLGFPVAAPPGVPQDRVAILRAGFADTMADAAYRADAERLMLAYSPKLGADLQADLVRLAATPASVVTRYRQLFNH